MRCQAILEVSLPLVGSLPVACTLEAPHLPGAPHQGRAELPLPRLGITVMAPFRWGGPLDGAPAEEPLRRPGGGS